MNETFKVAGVSNHKGTYKVRFANDLARVKVLSKGDTEIALMDLPQAMTKPEVVAFLKTTEMYANPSYREAIDTANAKYNPTDEPKITKTRAEKPAVNKSKPGKSKPSLEDIKARAAEQAAVVESAPDAVM